MAGDRQQMHEQQQQQQQETKGIQMQKRKKNRNTWVACDTKYKDTMDKMRM